MILQATILLPLLWAAERLWPSEAFLLPLILWLTVAINVLVLATRR